MPAARLINVLVVDDQESMRGIVRGHLRSLGFERILEANSAREAIEVLKTSQVQLILSDFNMDNGSGLDLLKFVRSHPIMKKTAFIMITGNMEKETVMSVMKAGVNNYIVKPVSAATLKQRLEPVIGKIT